MPDSKWSIDLEWRTDVSREKELSDAFRRKHAMRIYKTFQDKVGKFFCPVRDMKNERLEGRTDNETLIRFVKSVYIIGTFAPLLRVYLEERSFIQ